MKDLCTELEDKTKFAFPGNLVAYMTNLDGHGILEIRRDIEAADTPGYERLEASLRQQVEQTEWYKSRPAGSVVKFRRGKIEITPFGNLFLEACLKKLQDNDTLDR